MIARLKQIDFSSLKTILFFGLIVRLIAAFFSEGYGMHDDHYLVIEAAGSWVDGHDYNHWLPWTPDNPGAPEGHSFTYVGLNFLLLSFLKLIGIADPKMMMLINRLIHALFSLLVIRYGFKITERLSDRKTAVLAGWTLALLWAMPFLSVRNLVEVVSMPFLMWAVWLSIRDDKKMSMFYAGLLIGVAISFRYQIAVYAVGMGLFYLIRWEWNKLWPLILGTVTTFVLTQGLVDFFIWGYPFAEFIGYVVYNMNEGTGYMTNKNYFMYFYVLFGLLLFPFGILALIGYFRSAKKYLVLFLPTFLFLLFHTIYPNRQERFILTILPLVIVLAFLGIRELKERRFWSRFWKISWIAFWVLNIPMILIFSTTTSKKSRLNTMYALYNKTKGNEHILIEATGETNPEMMPFFYAGKWEYQFAERRREDTTNIETYLNNPHDIIFFFGQKNLDKRIREFKRIYPKMTKQTEIEPSMIDKTLHKINPRNSNSYVEIWRTNQ
jgi:Alg9-like mannosyltransferase family